MKVILYIATSINGYITQGKEDSDWVSEVDWTQFDKLKRESGIMVMGKRTYEQFKDDFPQDGALNVVMTHQPELLRKELKGAIFTDKTPKDMIEMTEGKGFRQMMLIGGMELITSFMKENLIDEIWLSVHPILIGEGLTIMDKFKFFKDLTFLSVKQFDKGLVQLRYKVIK